jgi:protoporphyrinogen oxidase
MKHIVIIGAGLTGLSAAYHLEQNGFFNYTLFEKENSPGGLCRSITDAGFTFDFTGHLLHINDPYFKELIEKIAPLHHFNQINRRSFIHSHNTYTKYPFQINLFGLPPDVISECIVGYVNRTQTSIKNPSFVQWVLENFGPGIAKHFFFPYQEKIFAYDIHKLSASWTGRFVPSTSLEQIVKGALTQSNDESIGYNASFFYPKQGGIFMWVEQLAQQLKNPIYTNYHAQRIDTRTQTVHFANGHTQKYDHLITTMPLDILISCMQEKEHTNLQSARSHLLCNSVTNFNLGIKNPHLSDKHWIYFPETKYPFYRVGFPHNFARSMAPEGCSSLYGEFAHIHKSKQWVTHTLKKSLNSLHKLLAIDPQTIITQPTIHIPHAYVIYDTWRDTNLAAIHDRLHSYNIYSVGRYGEWKYSSMQEAVLDGKNIAHTLIAPPQQHTKNIYPSIHQEQS